jgi:hypothetical protein
MKTCNSVWTYRAGRKRIMNQIIESEAYMALKTKPYALALFAYLSAENGPDASFWIADGLADSLGWPRRSIPAARRIMINLGLVKCVRPPAKGVPALYRWAVEISDPDLPYLVCNPSSPSPLPA